MAHKCEYFERVEVEKNYETQEFDVFRVIKAKWKNRELDVFKESFVTGKRYCKDNLMYKTLGGYLVAFPGEVERSYYYGNFTAEDGDYYEMVEQAKTPKLFVRNELTNEWCISNRYKIILADALPHCKYLIQKYEGTMEELLRIIVDVYPKHPEVEALVQLHLNKMALQKSTWKIKKAEMKKIISWLKVESTKHLFQREAPTLSINDIRCCVKNGYDLNTFKWRQSFARNVDKADLIAAGMNVEELFKYCFNNDIGFALYMDYFRACRYLGLSMKLSRNAYPHEFDRMHELRVNQMSSQKNKGSVDIQKGMIENAFKYSELEYKANGFIMCIATSPYDLVLEGMKLSHCVGRMGYDAKMAKGKSLIFFLRDAKNPLEPFVTVEYDPNIKTVLQNYGYKDTKPSRQCLDFIAEWSNYASNVLGTMTA